MILFYFSIVDNQEDVLMSLEDEASFVDKPKRRYPGVWFCSNLVLGKNVEIKPYAVLGGDGFGFKRDKLFRLQRIEQTRKVVIGNNVEIGSCTCIDRGQNRDTVIGEGTKFDNLVHVAHDCIIGKHVGIAAGAIFGGSVEVGDYTFIGLNVTVKPGVKIGKRCLIGMGSVVLKDVPDDVVVVGNPARVLRENLYFKKDPS